MKKFKVYGLKVGSEIDLLYTKASFETPDVIICFGKVPQTLENTLMVNKKCKYNEHQLIYSVKDIAHFLIEDGNKITIEAIGDCSYRTIKLYLDGIMFSCLLAQRGIPAYHGSVVKIKDKCLLIMGSSGAGKSSLTSGLLDYGCEFLSDDIIVFDVNNKALCVHPGFAEQKLSGDLVEEYQLHDLVDEKIYYPGKNKDKYFINRQGVFHKDTCPVDIVIYMGLSNGQLTMKQVTGIEKLDVVLKNTFRNQFMKAFNKGKEQFEMSTRIAKAVSVYLLQRPQDEFTVDQQVDMVLSLLEEEDGHN